MKSRGLGQRGSLELHPELPHAYLSLLLLLSQAHEQNTELKWRSWDSNWCLQGRFAFQVVA